MIDTVAYIWDRVAFRLHFNGCDIKRISRDHHQQSILACKTMFCEWLDGKGRKPTSWNTLIEALKEVEDSDIENKAEISKIATDLECILGTMNIMYYTVNIL